MIYGHFLSDNVAPRRITREVSMPVGFMGTYVHWDSVCEGDGFRIKSIWK